jgi:hypothetical protein
VKSSFASPACESAGGVGAVDRGAPSCEDAAQLNTQAAISGVKARAPAMAQPPWRDLAPALLIKR